MTKVMTPSAPMTDGQIDKAVDHYRNTLKKHRDEIGSSDAVQQVLGQPGYLAQLLAVIRKHAAAVSDLIVRQVKVDRTRTPQAMLEATGRKQYTDSNVVAAMPHGAGEEAEVYFFKPDLTKRGGRIGDADLEKEFEFRGFAPADPYTLAAVNRDDPAFADEHPNGTHWKDANGKWCYAAFDRWYGERDVSVSRYDYDWDDRWWFAGVGK